MKKVVHLVIAGFQPMVIKETIDEIVTAKKEAIKEAQEQGDLFYTRVDEDGKEYRGSCLVGLYRSVYETRILSPEDKKSKKS